MKKPRPELPLDAPIGTVWYGGPLEWFSVSLVVDGENLDPDAVSALLGAQPTTSQRKGIPILAPDGTSRTTPKFGQWELELRRSETDEWDVAEAVADLLAGLTPDLAAWAALTKIGVPRVSVGLTLETSNQGFSLPPALCSLLGARGIQLDLDVYGDEL